MTRSRRWTLATPTAAQVVGQRVCILDEGRCWGML